MYFTWGAGVCLPAEHCVHGFHPPLGGECPVWAAQNGTAGGGWALVYRTGQH